MIALIKACMSQNITIASFWSMIFRTMASVKLQLREMETGNFVVA